MKLLFFLIVAVFIQFLLFLGLVLAVQLTPDMTKDYSYTKNNPITVVNGKFQIGNIKVSLLTSINSTKYDMTKSNLTFDYSFKDYGYKRKWLINATKPFLTTVSIDYFKFSLEGCVYYTEMVFHCDNIELDFQDLVDSGYDVSIVNDSIIIKSNSFNVLNKIFLDPTDQLLPNATNKAYLVSNTLTNNPFNATTEFTSAQYTNINTSNNAYVTSTATNYNAVNYTTGCSATTSNSGCTAAGLPCTAPNNCPNINTVCINDIALVCSDTLPNSVKTSHNCTYTPKTFCTTCIGATRQCGSTYQCINPVGTCIYTCNAGYVYNGSACVLRGNFTFQRFTFNLSTYDFSSITDLQFCYEGKYSVTGTGFANLLYYNVVSSTWVNYSSISTTEGTICNSFDTTNKTNIYNTSSGLTQFSAKGNQTLNGVLTLFSDFAYLNVSWATTTTTTTTTTTATTTTTTTIPGIPEVVNFWEIMIYTDRILFMKQFYI